MVSTFGQLNCSVIVAGKMKCLMRGILGSVVSKCKSKPQKEEAKAEDNSTHFKTLFLRLQSHSHPDVYFYMT